MNSLPKMSKHNKYIVRDLHKLAVLKGEALSTKEQPHNKQYKYNRKEKHKQLYNI